MTSQPPEKLDAIAVAQGILMFKHGVDAVQALELMATLAALRGWALEDVARSVVEHHGLPLGLNLP